MLESEVIVAVLISGVALVLLGRGWLPPRSAKAVTTLGFLLAAAGAVLITRGRIDTASPPDRPLEVKADAYVSSDRCRSCHPAQYASWWGSYHRTMTQVPTPETVLGDFDDVDLELDGAKYHLFRRGDEFWVELDDPSWSAGRGERRHGEPRRVERRFELMTGSHHDQMYWHSTPGDESDLALFAFDYSLRLQRWIPTTSSFILAPGTKHDASPGFWRRTCTRCHTTNPPSDALLPDSTRPPQMKVAEFGISCEACHGPGKHHSEENRNPIRRYASYFKDERDKTIVQPAHLDSRLSAGVCGQCHGVWVGELRDQPYRPGMDIEKRRAYLQKRYLEPDYKPKDKFDAERQRVIRKMVRQEPALFVNAFWTDGVVRVSGREYNGLTESPCFQRGELSCLSCHTLHQDSDDPRSLAEWANDQVGVGKSGNGACTQCHGSFTGAALTAHTRHPAESAGSLCYNCHMSYSVYGIQKAHRSHQIANPSVQESVEVGRPNACNQCHLDKPLAWAAQHLNAWYDVPTPELSADEETLAAGALWALRGDAGLRALTAWSMGWKAARQASGAMAERDWMIPYLAQLLDDPYDSVRFIALLSLRERAELKSFDYDLVAPAEERRAAANRARGQRPFVHQSGTLADQAAVLLDESGTVNTADFAKLLGQRDDRAMNLRE